MERELVAWLRTRLPQHPEHVVVGPGDDAAVLRLDGNLVATTDMLMDGVDFHLREADPRRIGRKALAVNLSDLAAMAARPVAALVSLALPRLGGEQLARELYEGMLPLAEACGVSIAGGDTNSWDGPLAISVTALGETSPRGALLRSGARPGDAIVVTGSFGYSIEGHHFDFQPRVNEALLLHERYDLHAGADVSDGLSLDLARICEESQCGAVLDAAAIPVRGARPFSEETLARALGDGEDFELLLAVADADAQRMIAAQPCAPTPLTRIGQFVAERGLWLRQGDGKLRPLVPRGYEHKLEG